jgi:crotonobetainyl-CoA:carnitine CoA-transferase CaiB-like acyl-CoA transferase
VAPTAAGSNGPSPPSLPSPPRSPWATSGALSLTGPAGGPVLLAPAGIVDAIAARGRAVGVDAFDVLVERAACAGLRRHGTTSCGGATRIVRAADGWIALTLARPADVAVLPAWLGLEPDAREEMTDGSWARVADALAARPAGTAVATARVLGLAAATVGEHRLASAGPVRSHAVGAAPALTRPPVVVDLSALWAGPLCARVLAAHGARVVKLESRARPDGARRGPDRFYARLHHGHESVALDLATRSGIGHLERLLLAADVVIEASRPRALEQLGVHAADVAARGPRVWLSITGHGRHGPSRDWIAFGDDAAAAGGLVARAPEAGVAPCFVADAIADPLTGLVAAHAVLTALADGGRWLLDVALAAVAADAARWAEGEPWRAVDPGAAPRPPRPPSPGPAPRLGAHTGSVLAELASGSFRPGG